jgi:hypothetical protein
MDARSANDHTFVSSAVYFYPNAAFLSENRYAMIRFHCGASLEKPHRSQTGKDGCRGCVNDVPAALPDAAGVAPYRSGSVHTLMKRQSVSERADPRAEVGGQDGYY